MNDIKKVNVKVVEQISNEELTQLTTSLKKLEGFDFLVDCQLLVSETNTGYEEKDKTKKSLVSALATIYLLYD